MFGSVFRSILVIGTIYALSPVRLDATTLPSAAPAKPTSAAQKTAPALDPSAIQAAQSAALAMVTGGQAPKGQTKPQAPTSSGNHTRDQIGDLIALGKDLCLANPGLCAEIARSAAASATGQTQDQSPDKAQAKSPAKPIDTARGQDNPKAAEKAKPQQPAAAHHAPQSDLLGALIEKVATPAPRPADKPAEKMVAKVQR